MPKCCCLKQFMILLQIKLTRKIQLLLAPAITLPQEKNVDFAEQPYIAANPVSLTKWNVFIVV